MNDQDKELLARLEAATLKTAKPISFDGIDTLAKCIRPPHDADTITVAFPFKGDIYKYNLRLAGIDAPEINSKVETEKALAQAGKKFLTDLIYNKVIRAKMGKMDKFMRIIADIYLLDGTHINKLLIDKKFVRAYGGEKKAEWGENELKIDE